MPTKLNKFKYLVFSKVKLIYFFEVGKKTFVEELRKCLSEMFIIIFLRNKY